MSKKPFDGRVGERTFVVVTDLGRQRARSNMALGDGTAKILVVGGVEGVARFEKEPRMPDLDGFAACAKMRAVPEIGVVTPIRSGSSAT